MFYSQHDPAIDRELLAPGVTIHQYGCFLVSLANLYGVSPLDLLKVKGAFNAQGELFPNVLAKACGGESLGPVSHLSGWGIACTDHYASLGYNTHFFCINLETKQKIDPLNFPAFIEPLEHGKHYNVTSLRYFTNIKLGVKNAVPVILEKPAEVPAPVTAPILPENVAPETEIQNLERREEHTEDPVRKFSLQRLIIRLIAKFRPQP